MFGRFEVPIQPAIVVLGADGRTERLQGALDESLLDEVLTSVVGAPPG